MNPRRVKNRGPPLLIRLIHLPLQHEIHSRAQSTFALSEAQDGLIDLIAEENVLELKIAHQLAIRQHVNTVREGRERRLELLAQVFPHGLDGRYGGELGQRGEYDASVCAGGENLLLWVGGG